MEFALFKAHLLYYLKQTLALFWGKLGLGLIFVALFPHWAAFQGLMLLFCIDFVCGVWVAKKTKTLSSFGMRRGIAKLAIYFIFITSISLAEQVTGTSIGTLSAIGLLSATEVLSITENLVLLGLPVPYAAKILRLVSTKAQSMGIDVGDNPGAAAAVKDMVDLLQDTIPTIKDKNLRKCLDVYVTHWYLFMRDLQPGSMVGAPELVAERLGSQVDHVLCDIRAALTREGIELKTQVVFLNIWNKALLSRLLIQVKACCLEKDTPAEEKIDRIRDQLVLMSLRLVRYAQKVDSATEDVLLTHPDTTVETDPTRR